MPTGIGHLLDLIADRRALLGRPLVVAIDGGSGAGKSTLGAALARRLDAALFTLDDFYQTSIPESDLLKLSIEDRLQNVFDWQRVRDDVLRPLREGRAARWHAFDFLAGLSQRGTYALRDEPSELAPRPIVVMEGSYSCSPPLVDLVDLRVLVRQPEAERRRRVEGRGDADYLDLGAWREVWPPVERHYFAQVCPPESFDVVIDNDVQSATA